MIRGQRLVLIAGVVLIVLGIIVLILSDEVASGWWQGTSQALGVGFIVGGLVDVLAISGLNEIMATEERQQTALWKKRGEEILAQIPHGDLRAILGELQNDKLSLGDRASVLARLDWREREALLRQLDPQQYDALWPLVFRLKLRDDVGLWATDWEIAICPLPADRGGQRRYLAATCLHLPRRGHR